MSRARLATALTIGLMGASVVFAPPALADHLVTRTFHPTGGEQTYTIPAGVTKLRVVAIGGRGGNGADGGDGSAPSGRRGHRATADLAVPSGVTQLVVAVGQNGGHGNGANGGVPGFGGGAPGGLGTPFAGGAGGGASDVRLCSAAAPCDSLSSRLIVAPGGGGGGGRCFAIGCVPGTNAGNGGDNTGGTPGIPGPGGFPGLPGIFGFGGLGAPGNPATAGGGGGGGGGGGWYGGGGGASGFQAPTPLIIAVDGGDGGNGSARAGAGVSNFVVEETDEEPSVTISYLVESTTITYTGPSSGFTGDPVTLSARLTATTSGTPVPNAALVFRLNSTETCVGTTNANGVASCSITPNENAGTYSLAIGYGGDVVHHPSSTQVQFEVTRKPTTLTYTGALTGDFHDPATVSARLTLTGTGAPVGDQPVVFTLNNTETCTGTTNASGVASCSITPNEPAGTYPVTAAFAGSKGLLPSNTGADFVVTKEETALTYTGDATVANAEPARLAAKLTEDDGTPVAARTVQLNLGEQSCVDTTDTQGTAECTITSVDQPLNPTATVPVTATFAGDQFYEPSQTSTTAGLQHMTGRGFGLSGNALGLTMAPTPDTGEVRVARATTTTPPCVANLPVGARALCTSVVTTLTPGTSTARTSVTEVGIGIIALRDVVATSRSTCAGATGTVTIGALTVAGLPITVSTAPNTTIPLPGGKIVINEQVPAPGGLKVNGAHITLPGVDLVVSSATSGIHNC
ncbi:Ig-like domain-containing protein [Lentzea atacamensis]|uniref:Ig-like domain-containing protein n=1 Tax=Lentzea atacamensis TaxID=531938 RepID=A0A316HDX9_9PSEU|nr:choice-of-anchor P family protein [Lentzea atacamensis]PWK78587.1 Ig-like domain-containing protein [Lentzea atacamensis]